MRIFCCCPYSPNPFRPPPPPSAMFNTYIQNFLHLRKTKATVLRGSKGFEVVAKIWWRFLRSSSSNYWSIGLFHLYVRWLPGFLSDILSTVWVMCQYPSLSGYIRTLFLYRQTDRLSDRTDVEKHYTTQDWGHKKSNLL